MIRMTLKELMVLTTTTDLSGGWFISWLYGYYVMAKFVSKRTSINKSVMAKQISLLHNHFILLSESVWLSLPELTQGGGVECLGSCPSQLWSIATLLEAINLMK